MTEPISEKFPENNTKIQNNEMESNGNSYLQMVISFLFSGIGMVFSGILFTIVLKWDVFINVKEIIVLVPALLGLKGNLDMSLASRLSTQVNIGEIYDKKTVIQAINGNVALKLLQSIVVGLLASFVACLTRYITAVEFRQDHLLILIATSVTSAAITIIFSLVVMFVILISKKLNYNPDNVATPLASSLGDVGTLMVLSIIGTFFYTYRQQYWIHIVIIVALSLSTPLLFIIAHRNTFVKQTLHQGWLPVITAMFISSASGIILNIAVPNYPAISAYQPVVNGFGGNLVSVYSSRLSTQIAREPDSFGKWVSWAPKRFIFFPYDTFFGKLNPEAKTAQFLMCLVIPGHLIFFYIIYSLSDFNYRPNLNLSFFLLYYATAFLQVTLLFLICYFLVHIVWRLKRNPDDYCISLLTSIGDLFGVSLLYLCFYMIFISSKPIPVVLTQQVSIISVQTNITLFLHNI